MNEKGKNSFFMFNNMNRSDLNSKYFGLHSCRYQGAKLQGNTLYHTQGSYVSTLCLPCLKPKPLFKAHNSMISALTLRPYTTPPSILSVDYYGNISIHTFEGQLLSFNHEPRNSVVPKGVRSAVSNPSGTLLAVLSIGGNPYNGTIEVYSTSNTEIRKLKELIGNFKQCEFIDDSDLFVLRENIIDPGIENVTKQRDRPIPLEEALNDFEPDVEEELDGEGLLRFMTYNSKRIVTYYAIRFFDIAKQRVGNVVQTDIYERVNCIQQNFKQKVAFATIGRTVHVMDMATLQMMHSLKLKGSGSMAMLQFCEDHVYFSPQSNYLCKFFIEQHPVKGEFFVDRVYGELAIVKVEESWVHKNNFLCWVEEGRTILSLNEYGNFIGTFVDFPSSGQMVNVGEEVLFRMTCCGLEIHPSLSLVAVGDFSGKVVVFDCESSDLVASTGVQGSVRSVAWKGEKVFIGTIEGLLYSWDFQEEEEAQIFYSFSSTVVCMKWYKEVLALGCTSGELFFMQDSQVVHQVMAHERQESDEKFGSLGLFSEIWSLTWSPNGEFFATGSEDQTIKVWRWSPWEHLVTLPRHERAVTGVRWEEVRPFEHKGRSINEILVTCSDDESLRIYDPVTWDLLHVLKTSVIQEWHTVTYASVQPKGDKVACVTQNGFIFLVSLPSFTCTTVERVHNGSIEGLDWKQNLVTCSSEGLCCIIKS